MRPSGDMIPWTLGQQYPDSSFGSLAGVGSSREATIQGLTCYGTGTSGAYSVSPLAAEEGVCY